MPGCPTVFVPPQVVKSWSLTRSSKPTVRAKTKAQRRAWLVSRKPAVDGRLQTVGPVPLGTPPLANWTGGRG